ncbi:hypothetical protein K504DRAFT_462089 [Pleomassaria siparia CBS 279.74]|uniref:HMG box domain-containing protein n=1 Tax=Pleomassaria siparia CBS 279.74 TaxID=1314801 RepID=A0A6G1KL01_9PLEO|nr:hypothetical protein K504DRAFT_462089 [Pleomassaria siparia CBS 279.74]
MRQVIISLSNLQAGLTHVQNGLNELLRAYMQHTASVLAGDNIAETLQLPAHITATANAAVEAANTAASALGQAVPAAPKMKRKREKKIRDPNAPKRPLTAMFLYASAARDIVKADLAGALGPDEKIQPNAVNLEITKRWNEMAEEDKEKWKASYRDSLTTYLKEKEQYEAKTGVSDPVLHEEEPSDEAEAGALDSDASSDSEDENAAVAPTPIKVPTPPVANTKTPRPNKRQKTAAVAQVNGSVPTVPVAIAPATTPHTVVPFPVIPNARVTQVLPPGATSEVPVPTPVKEKKDKKKKTAPQPIAPAPAKEPSPEDPKKKAKGARSTRNTEVEADIPAVVAATPTAELKGPAKKRDRSKRKSEGVAI